MAKCLIQDKLFHGDDTPLVGFIVTTSPNHQPVFIKEVSDGVFHPVESPWPSDTTDSTGQFSINLPYSDAGDVDPATLQWSIVLPTAMGTWLGPVPADAGPHTIKDLKDNHGWGFVSSTPATVTAVQGPPGVGSLVGQSITGALSTVADAPAKAVLTSIIASLVYAGDTNGTT